MLQNAMDLPIFQPNTSERALSMLHMPFSIFLKVYDAFIANGYTWRIDRMVGGK